MEAFEREEGNFESFAVYAESKLQEAITTGNVNQGASKSIDPGLPAVCCDLLVKMSDSAFGFRFAPLLKLLAAQVVRICYSTVDGKEILLSDGELEKCSIRWLFAQKPWFER